MNTVKSRRIYRIKGATWQIDLIKPGKWAVYRRLRNDICHYGNFRTLKASLAYIHDMIPAGE